MEVQVRSNSRGLDQRGCGLNRDVGSRDGTGGDGFENYLNRVKSTGLLMVSATERQITAISGSGHSTSEQKHHGSFSRPGKLMKRNTWLRKMLTGESRAKVMRGKPNRCSLRNRCTGHKQAQGSLSCRLRLSPLPLTSLGHPGAQVVSAGLCNDRKPAGEKSADAPSRCPSDKGT